MRYSDRNEDVSLLALTKNSSIYIFSLFRQGKFASSFRKTHNSNIQSCLVNKEGRLLNPKWKMLRLPFHFGVYQNPKGLFWSGKTAKCKFRCKIRLAHRSGIFSQKLSQDCENNKLGAFIGSEPASFNHSTLRQHSKWRSISFCKVCLARIWIPRRLTNSAILFEKSFNIISKCTEI